jgi:hypothetical protein
VHFGSVKVEHDKPHNVSIVSYERGDDRAPRRWFRLNGWSDDERLELSVYWHNHDREHSNEWAKWLRTWLLTHPEKSAK